MSELGKQLREFMVSDIDINSVVGVKVCEDIVPEGTSPPFIWFQQSGEVPSDCLNSSYIESTTYDVECVSDDIEEARTLTQYVKDAIRSVSLESIEFEQTVHTAEISTHDDSYVPKSIDEDAGEHVGALIIELHHASGFTGAT